MTVPRGMPLWAFPTLVFDSSTEHEVAAPEPPSLAGFAVQAVDGEIGTIDSASYDVGRCRIVIDTGPWILGKKVVLPAGVVSAIDPDAERVYVNCTKDQIKHAPRLSDDQSSDDAEHREQLSRYYGESGAAPRHS